MRKHKLNSSADVDRYLNIKSMDGDSRYYAYDLPITEENSRSIYAVSDVYGWTYKVDKKTTAVWQNGKKLADRCTYSIDEYFDVERPVNSSKRSKKLNSSMDYTWEINTKDFQYGTQRGYITPADIDAFVGDLISTYGCTATHPTENTWYLNDLSFADYEDLERNYWKEVGYYISAKSKKVNSSRRGAKMIKTSKKLNSATNAQFNEKAFDHYLKNLVADCVDYVGECGDVVQIIEHMYPGYDWRWAAEGTDLDWDLARKELEDALYKYLKIQYLAYK